MKVEELKEKVYAISNCEFPLYAFLNDVLSNTNPRFNKEMALRDIEKICDTFNEFRKENEELKAQLNNLNIRKEEVRKKYLELKERNAELLKTICRLSDENFELKERMQVYEKYVSIRGMNNDELWCNSKITEEEKKLLYTQEYIDKKDNHYEEMLKKNMEVK